MAAALPLDPPLERMGDSWDALDGSLWGGFHTIAETRVAILWPDALTLADADPAAYEVALSIFSALTHGLRNPEYLGGGSPTTVAVAIGT